MIEPERNTTAALTRQAVSDAVTELGWRNVLGAVRTKVRTTSMAHGADVVTSVVKAAGDASASLSADLRPTCVLLSLQSPATAWVTPREIDAARRISAALAAEDLATLHSADHDGGRTVQAIELAVDAMDIASVRLFWKAVLAYTDEGGASGPEDALVDPLGQGPAVWFQQMDTPRRERNRIHLDISVPHDEAPKRIEAALAAGGVLRSAQEAPAFWLLADAEGNEACITTWQGRDA